MLGLGNTLLSPYLTESGYVNTHSLSVDGAGSGSDADFLNSNTTLQSQLRDSHSWSLWLKLDEGNPSTSAYIVGSANSSNIYGIYITSSGILGHVFFSATGSVNEGRSVYNANAATFSSGANDWTHVGVVITETGGTMGVALYVNGEEIAGTAVLSTMNAAAQSSFSPSVNIPIGAYVTSSGGFAGIDGLIDEVAFFDDALTADEMSAIGAGGGPTDLTGHDHLYLYYKLNNNTNDEVGNSNGSLNGQAAFSTTTP
tara:strand:- start:1123 stop:1890 length:768 start_codon:yes stop_codon:yes gene_type:complete